MRQGAKGRRWLAALLGLALLATAACTGAKLETGAEVSAGDGISAGDDGTATTVAGQVPADGVVPGSPAAGDPAAPGTPGAPTTPGSPGPSIPGVPGPPADGFRSTLFAGAGDRAGITSEEIRLCAHAALTYGAAFNTSADDLNVYWTAVNEAGGVYGRAVKTYYENDNYTPEDAIKAATACKDKHDPFMLLGGIGFDQIPAVRNWAEQNKVLYFHHTATVNGSEGKQYSFTGLPTTEKSGAMFAELAATRFGGKKVGIIKRQSPNWEPGVDGFKQVAKERGVQIVLDRAVPQNKGSYLQDILDLQNAKADVVWVWLNALESTQFIKQAKAQGFSPDFMVFPFNLMSQTLGNDALNPKIVGLAMYQAYSKGDYSGEFAKYASDMQQFEQQYAKYRPNVDLGGVGADLLFLNWSGQKVMHQLLLQCGPDCTRNRMVELLHNFKAKLTPSSCELDFTRAGNDRRGAYALSVLEAYRSPSGKVNFRNTQTCVEHL